MIIIGEIHAQIHKYERLRYTNPEAWKKLMALSPEEFSKIVTEINDQLMDMKIEDLYKRLEASAGHKEPETLNLGFEIDTNAEEEYRDSKQLDDDYPEYYPQ